MAARRGYGPPPSGTDHDSLDHLEGTPALDDAVTRAELVGLSAAGVAACVQLMSLVGAGLFAGSVAFVLSVAGAVLCLGVPGVYPHLDFPLPAGALHVAKAGDCS
jgi:hypothetical protein